MFSSYVDAYYLIFYVNFAQSHAHACKGNYTCATGCTHHTCGGTAVCVNICFPFGTVTNSILLLIEMYRSTDLVLDWCRSRQFEQNR